MKDNKAFLHLLWSNELNITVENFIEYYYLIPKKYGNWYDASMRDSEVVRRVIFDLKNIKDLYITSVHDPRIRHLTIKAAKNIFDWKHIIKEIRKNYEETK
jgi:hypothetical protein